jgi:hypothetical protein
MPELAPEPDSTGGECKKKNTITTYFEHMVGPQYIFLKN